MKKDVRNGTIALILIIILYLLSSNEIINNITQAIFTFTICTIYAIITLGKNEKTNTE